MVTSEVFKFSMKNSNFGRGGGILGWSDLKFLSTSWEVPVILGGGILA